MHLFFRQEQKVGISVISGRDKQAIDGYYELLPDKIRDEMLLAWRDSTGLPEYSDLYH